VAIKSIHATGSTVKRGSFDRAHLRAGLVYHIWSGPVCR
jgi:hypothetical protein